MIVYNVSMRAADKSVQFRDVTYGSRTFEHWQLGCRGKRSPRPVNVFLTHGGIPVPGRPHYSIERKRHGHAIDFPYKERLHFKSLHNHKYRFSYCLFQYTFLCSPLRLFRAQIGTAVSSNSPRHLRQHVHQMNAMNMTIHRWNR